MLEEAYLSNGEAIRATIQAFLDLNLLAWHGLPRLQAVDFIGALGTPAREEEVRLGLYPARRLIYTLATPSGGLGAFVRNNEVIMLEALKPPALSATQELESPCAIKPHEILTEDAYIHEYLYCQRGLVLGIAQPYLKELPLKVARCRAIHSIETPEQFGSELYLSFENRIDW